MIAPQLDKKSLCVKAFMGQTPRATTTLKYTPLAATYTEQITEKVAKLRPDRILPVNAYKNDTNSI